MMKQVLGAIVLIVMLLSPAPEAREVREEVLAEHVLDLETRAGNEYVNEVFRFNILHAIGYFGDSFILEPGEAFVFHENILPEFADLPVKTGGTRYTTKEGYKTALGLPGNGICHLASLMNWTASDAGLEVVARVNHNFAPVPGVPREYGTSIRYCSNGCNSQNQNLYIKNTLDFPVEFSFQTTESGVNLKIDKRGDAKIR